MQHRLWHYDGQSALRHEGDLVARPDGFDLQRDDGGSEHLPWAVLSHNGTKGSDHLYTHVDRPGWVIGLSNVSVDALADYLPKKVKYGRWVDRLGLAPASAIFLTLSACVAFIVYKTPETLAPLVPLSWEKKLGDSMVGRLEESFCSTPDGNRALKQMTARLGETNVDVDIHVANIDMINAVALPGGTIIIFQGLLNEAGSPQEVAGIVGHEVGHVSERHVMESLLRQMGISVILGGVDGNIGTYANTLISATFSRDAEEEADNYAIKAMKKADVDPNGVANFFLRMAQMEGEVGAVKSALGYLSSHPLSENREKAFRASGKSGAKYPPVLSDTEWHALRQMCSNDPKAKKSDSLFF